MKYKILMISSELVPFAKTGGLADVVSALSTGLKENGNDVRIIMPLYKSIDKSKLCSINKIIKIEGNFEYIKLEIYKGLLTNNIPVYFIDNKELYNRDYYYGDKSGVEYQDNALRFSMLSRAALELCKEINWFPDIFHCHDWQSALTSVYLAKENSNPNFNKAASILTIHNIGFQGIFSKHNLHDTALEWNELLPDKEAKDLNYLKTGIKSADIINTVSPRYAKEIQTADYSHALDKVLKKRKSDLFGILNGVDENQWNPETDNLLTANYNSKNLHKKAINKTHIQKAFRMNTDPSIPLIVMISRLSRQKGFKVLCEKNVIKSICEDLNCQLIILGTGDRQIERKLKHFEKHYENLTVLIEFNNKLAHLLEAAGDFFLMPSEYEPCGLNQMYSLKYGTIPIVRKTGGLADTVKQFSEVDGNGFVFETLDRQNLLQTIQTAAEIFRNDKNKIIKLRKNGMSEDFTWEKSVKEYQKLYKNALDKTLKKSKG